MTVDELRAELEGVPGHYRVFVVCEAGSVTVEAWGADATEPPYGHFYINGY